MEVCVPTNMPACKDISSGSEFSTAPSNSTNFSSQDLSLNDMMICPTEFLSIDIEISTGGFNLSSGDNNKCNVMRDDKCSDSYNEKSSSSASEKCFSNCVTVPGEPASSIYRMLGQEKGQDDSKASKANDVCYSQSSLLPVPLKLVSAMKGSRKKQSMLPKKLSVGWAPDVYDPIPMAVCPVPPSKNHHHRSDGKKYGKHKQKGSGKSSRGSKGKDKKLARENGSSSTKFKPPHNDSVVIGLGGPQLGIIDCNAVIVDPFCGSSFLGKSVAHLNFPATEAT